MNIHLQTHFLDLLSITILDHQSQLQQHFGTEGTPTRTHYVLSYHHPTTIRQLLSIRQAPPRLIYLLRMACFMSGSLLFIILAKMGPTVSLTDSAARNSAILLVLSISLLMIE